MNPVTRPVILIILVLGLAIHLGTLVLARGIMAGIVWQHLPSHTAIEITGALIAFVVAYSLFCFQKQRLGTSFNQVLGSALVSMGILDGIHALTSPGDNFVWLHSMATLCGGLFMVLTWLPRRWQNRLPFIRVAIMLSIGIVIFAVTFPDTTPQMIIDGQFSLLAKLLNIGGGILMLATSVRLFLCYRQHRRSDDLLFILLSAMFGMAAIMFEISRLWDISWWGWHMLRFAAYSLALFFVLANDQEILTRILARNDDLNAEVKTTSDKLNTTRLELAVSQARQNAVFRCLTDAIIICDTKGVIRFFSPPAERMFGYHHKHVVGKNVTCLMTHEQARFHPHYIANFQSAKESTIVGANRELIAVRASGQTFPIELSISSLQLGDEQAFTGVIRDISERKAYEHQLKQAKEASEAASLAKSAFLANTSHEIRTPMNGVYGNLQLLQRESLSPSGQDFLDKALMSTRTLITIINDILDFSKIEAGKLQLEHAPFSVRQLVANILSDLDIAARKKQLKMHVLIDVDHDCWLGDPIRIRQILLNLTSNAIKFTLKGNVTVSVLSTPPKKQLTFIVTDTGIGMNETALASLFNRFEQADSSTTRRFGGTGLGMSITHSLVTLMKGSIDVSSVENEGTVFTVRLPLQQAEDQRVTSNPDMNQVPDLKDKRLLIAEDNEINQSIIEAMLEETQCRIMMVENGKDALDCLESNAFDLVLMDIQMPVMDGIQACKVIKQQYPDLPVIALTANVMAEDVAHYRAVGFDDHIGKPIEKDYLFHTLNIYLRAAPVSKDKRSA